MEKKFWTILMCAGFAMIPLVVSAQQGPASAGMEDKIAAEDQKIESELGISPEQKQKMQELRQEFQAKQKALNEEIKGKRDALRGELDGDAAPNRGKVNGLVAEIKTLQGKVLEMRVDQVFNMRALLTPEQYQKLKEIRKKRQAEAGMKGEAAGKMREKGEGKPKGKVPHKKGKGKE